MKETKFKVGDRVRVKGLVDCSLSEKKPYVDSVFTIEKILYGNGTSKFDFCYHSNDNRYNWCDDELEFVAEKDNLKDGMVVEFRNGWRALVVAKTFLTESGYYNDSQFTDDLLSWSVFPGTNNKPSMDIAKIYRVKNNSALDILGVFNTNNLTLIWERKEVKKEPKYKVGDRVRVRSDLQQHKMYNGVPVSIFMDVLAGKVVTISETNVCDDIKRYRIHEWTCIWTDDMFEGLVDYEEMTVAEIEEKLGYKVKVIADKE